MDNQQLGDGLSELQLAAIQALGFIEHLYPGVETAQRLRAALRQSEELQGWIPVSERLPENKQRVIVAMDNGEVDGHVVFYEGMGFRFIDQVSVSLDEGVEFWRKLPPAPTPTLSRPDLVDADKDVNE